VNYLKQHYAIAAVRLLIIFLLIMSETLLNMLMELSLAWQYLSVVKLLFI